MATRKQVKCINKRGNHYEPHERIQGIGGVDNGTRWKRSEDTAISYIKNGTEEYYVIVNDKSVDVIVDKHDGREYLKTKNDGYAPNNLLNLDECPA